MGAAKHVEHGEHLVARVGDHARERRDTELGRGGAPRGVEAHPVAPRPGPDRDDAEPVGAGGQA
jgi:hypothetical protein